ncbi:hypothetical protein ABZ471_47895, partial [Streptomyces sp. NPDC005728]
MKLPDLSEERSELGRSLLARGAITAAWMDAFEAVPRSAFLPEVMWPYDMTSGTHVTVNLRAEPGLWFQYARTLGEETHRVFRARVVNPRWMAAMRRH